MTTRDYTLAGLTIHWDSEVCIHSGVCARTLPRVFRPRERPWIDTDGATAEEIASTIDACPSGALRYTRTAGTPEVPESHDSEPVPVPEAPAAETVAVTVHENGPYEVRGVSRVLGADGRVLKESARVTYLCRCGGSSTKPFCDGTHNRNGFTDPGLGG